MKREREKYSFQLLHPHPPHTYAHVCFNPGSSTPRLAHNRRAFNYHCTRAKYSAMEEVGATMLAASRGYEFVRAIGIRY